MIENSFGQQQEQTRENNRAQFARQGAIQGGDPWIHRSEGMRCKSCIWFVPKQANNKLGYDLGRCRRHAPTMNGYPVVFVNDWCGDHRIDENKV
jgi:Pyruvate/2-oxoacid:ferredoxin oxidoreductase delta subunit